MYKRQGIPTIDEAWKKANHPEKANTAEGLREIVPVSYTHLDGYKRQVDTYLCER